MMALNPAIQRKCQEEIDNMFHLFPEPCKTGQLSLSIVQEHLEYVEQCILETMRLFPPGYLLGREIVSPLRIELKGKSIEIPARTMVLYSPYLLHRNEEYYPDPMKFDPDRFLPEEKSQRPACAYIPFSAGIRNCLASKLAMMELKILAAYVLQNFDIETVDALEDIPLLPTMTLTPERDMRFRFRKRCI